MRVKLLPIDKEEIINKIYAACRTCYTSGSPINMYDNEVSHNVHTEEEKLKLIKYVLSSQHHSVCEHVQLTFIIEGISRACALQLVRHRHASYSQSSQRYIEFKDGKFPYVIPNTIKGDNNARKLFESAMEVLSEGYHALTKMGIPAEDARALLPNACCTNITVSMNIRELMHVCNERLCTCAQEEIRTMVREMVEKVTKELPFLKKYLVPKCEMLGYCNEPKRSCGRKKLRSEVIG